ncbi:MAG: hypothetical protein ACQER7_02070 [Bacteroidota bacterium]
MKIVAVKDELKMLGVIRRLDAKIPECMNGKITRIERQDDKTITRRRGNR